MFTLKVFSICAVLPVSTGRQAELGTAGTNDLRQPGRWLGKFFCLLLTTIGLLGSSQFSWAIVELGATGNYRKSVIDKHNFQESTSYTASLSYYFWELSALELSYTNGLSKVVIKASASEPKNITTTDFTLVGLDLVFTFAGRDSPLQPYVKLGSAYIEKEILREIEGGATTRIGNPKGTVPSAGLGVKLRVDNSISIKFGLDAWTSPLSADTVTIDYAGRAGISWIF